MAATSPSATVFVDVGVSTIPSLRYDCHMVEAAMVTQPWRLATIKDGFGVLRDCDSARGWAGDATKPWVTWHSIPPWPFLDLHLCGGWKSGSPRFSKLEREGCRVLAEVLSTDSARTSFRRSFLGFRETDQGETVFEFDDRLYKIRIYDRNR
ncbi:MAG: hypothetical protein AAB403_05905 [Planctomycetota bacterium]